MRLTTLGMLAAIAVGLWSGAASASPPPLVPAGLHQGDHYQLAFVTSITTSIDTDTTVPPDIPSWGGVAAADYLVTNSAAAVGLVPNWDHATSYYTAILSNQAKDARDRVSVLAPLYNTHGDLVATNAADLWDSTLSAPIKYDEQGNLIASNFAAWSGSLSNGTHTLSTAGSNWSDPTKNGTIGNILVTTSQWSNIGVLPGSSSARLYAVSPLLTVPSILPGDVNFDSIVNGQDIALIASNWLHHSSSVPGDANNDWIVNGQDLALVASNWLAVPAPSVPVPEPSSIVVAAICGAILLLWRKRLPHA